MNRSTGSLSSICHTQAAAWTSHQKLQGCFCWQIMFPCQAQAHLLPSDSSKLTMLKDETIQSRASRRSPFRMARSWRSRSFVGFSSKPWCAKAKVGHSEGSKKAWEALFPVGKCVLFDGCQALPYLQVGSPLLRRCAGGAAFTCQRAFTAVFCRHNSGQWDGSVCGVRALQR